MNTKDMINYVVDVNGDLVTVKFFNGKVADIPISKAKELVAMQQLYGYVDGEFIPCLKMGAQHFPKYYLKDDVLYRADSAMIYNDCSSRLTADCKFYTVDELYVICYEDQHFVVMSNVLRSGFTVNDVSSFKLDDGRLYVVVQGLSSFCYGTVQAVYNELLYVAKEGVYCLFHSNKKRMEEILRYYRPVEAQSTDVKDIRQKIVNACIESELNKLDVTCHGHVIILGNIAIDMGGG